MSFVNQIKDRDGIIHDVHDKRIDNLSEQLGKLLQIGEDGNLQGVDLPVGFDGEVQVTFPMGSPIIPPANFPSALGTYVLKYNSSYQGLLIFTEQVGGPDNARGFIFYGSKLYKMNVDKTTDVSIGSLPSYDDVTFDGTVNAKIKGAPSYTIKFDRPTSSGVYKIIDKDNHEKIGILIFRSAGGGGGGFAYVNHASFSGLVYVPDSDNNAVPYSLLLCQYRNSGFGDSSSQWDTTPTENSTKPVTSGGIKTYVDNNKGTKLYRHSLNFGEGRSISLINASSSQITDYHNIASDSNIITTIGIVFVRTQDMPSEVLFITKYAYNGGTGQTNVETVEYPTSFTDTVTAL